MTGAEGGVALGADCQIVRITPEHISAHQFSHFVLMRARRPQLQSVKK